MRLIRLLKYDLAREATTWASDGLISTSQAEAICLRYGVDYHNLSRRSLGYHVLVGLGCLFIGLAVITLLSANWDQIPRTVRMGGLLLATFGVNLFGLYKFKREQTTAAIGWFFLGGLFYGASIMLIAQIFHIDEHYPNGIFWWAMGVLPLGILLNSALLMTLALCLAFIWFFVESGLGFYPVLFPLFLAATAWFLGRGGQSKILFLALIAGLVIWAEYTLSWFIGHGAGFQPGPENVALGIGLFLALHGLAAWLSSRKDHVAADYGALLGLWVLRFGLITLFVFSFRFPWRAMIEANWLLPGATLVISLFLCVLALWAAYRARASLLSTAVFSLLFVVGISAVMTVENRLFDVVFQIIGNIVLVGAGIWLIVFGIRDNISHYFYIGVMAILGTGLLRYIDLVGDYVGAAILFAVLAAVLLFAAKFWKSHHAAAGGMS